jgi:hypothetical protein
VLYRIKSNATNKLLEQKAFKEYCTIIEDLLNKIEDKYFIKVYFVYFLKILYFSS